MMFNRLATLLGIPTVVDAVRGRIERLVADVSAAAAAVGLAPHGMTASPITGATGNQEYLLHLRAGAAAERVNAAGSPA